MLRENFALTDTEVGFCFLRAELFAFEPGPPVHRHQRAKF
jgi:hypothetical protein